MSPVDRINRQYVRRIKFARSLRSLHNYRNELICQARAERIAALRSLGIRARR